MSISSPVAIPSGFPTRRRPLFAVPSGDVRAIENGAFGRVATLWAASRACNLLVLLTWFHISSTSRWSFGPDGYRAASLINFLTGWDADRYGAIAEQGYPSTLPTDHHGTVLPNNWAFLPVFPGLVRTLTEITGLPWRPVALGIALAAGLVATWMPYVLLRHVASPERAWWATVVFSVAPTSFILVVGYSEGLFLALTFAALLLAAGRGTPGSHRSASSPLSPVPALSPSPSPWPSFSRRGGCSE